MLVARVNLRIVDMEIDSVERDRLSVLYDIQTVLLLAKSWSMDDCHLLDDDFALVFKGLKVGLQREVIVSGSDIFGEDLTAF